MKCIESRNTLRTPLCQLISHIVNCPRIMREEFTRIPAYRVAVSCLAQHLEMLLDHKVEFVEDVDVDQGGRYDRLHVIYKADLKDVTGWSDVDRVVTEVLDLLEADVLKWKALQKGVALIEANPYVGVGTSPDGSSLRVYLRSWVVDSYKLTVDVTNAVITDIKITPCPHGGSPTEHITMTLPAQSVTPEGQKDIATEKLRKEAVKLLRECLRTHRLPSTPVENKHKRKAALDQARSAVDAYMAHMIQPYERGAVSSTTPTQQALTYKVVVPSTLMCNTCAVDDSAEYLLNTVVWLYRQWLINNSKDPIRLSPFSVNVPDNGLTVQIAARIASTKYPSKRDLACKALVDYVMVEPAGLMLLTEKEAQYEKANAALREYFKEVTGVTEFVECRGDGPAQRLLVASEYISSGDTAKGASIVQLRVSRALDVLTDMFNDWKAEFGDKFVVQKPKIWFVDNHQRKLGLCLGISVPPAPKKEEPVLAQSHASYYDTVINALETAVAQPNNSACRNAAAEATRVYFHHIVSQDRALMDDDACETIRASVHALPASNTSELVAELVSALAGEIGDYRKKSTTRDVRLGKASFHIQTGDYPRKLTVSLEIATKEAGKKPTPPLETSDGDRLNLVLQAVTEMILAEPVNELPVSKEELLIKANQHFQDYMKNLLRLDGFHFCSVNYTPNTQKHLRVDTKIKLSEIKENWPTELARVINTLIHRLCREIGFWRANTGNSLLIPYVISEPVVCLSQKGGQLSMSLWIDRAASRSADLESTTLRSCAVQAIADVAKAAVKDNGMCRNSSLVATANERVVDHLDADVIGPGHNWVVGRFDSAACYANSVSVELGDGDLTDCAAVLLDKLCDGLKEWCARHDLDVRTGNYQRSYVSVYSTPASRPIDRHKLCANINLQRLSPSKALPGDESRSADLKPAESGAQSTPAKTNDVVPDHVEAAHKVIVKYPHFTRRGHAVEAIVGYVAGLVGNNASNASQAEETSRLIVNYLDNDVIGTGRFLPTHATPRYIEPVGVSIDWDEKAPVQCASALLERLCDAIKNWCAKNELDFLTGKYNRSTIEFTLTSPVRSTDDRKYQIGLRVNLQKAMAPPSEKPDEQDRFVDAILAFVDCPPDSSELDHVRNVLNERSCAYALSSGIAGKIRAVSRLTDVTKLVFTTTLFPGRSDRKRVIGDMLTAANEAVGEWIEANGICDAYRPEITCTWEDDQTEVVQVSLELNIGIYKEEGAKEVKPEPLVDNSLEAEAVQQLLDSVEGASSWCNDRYLLSDLYRHLMKELALGVGGLKIADTSTWTVIETMPYDVFNSTPEARIATLRLMVRDLTSRVLDFHAKNPTRNVYYAQVARKGNQLLLRVTVCH